MFRWSMRCFVAAGELEFEKPGSLSCDRSSNRVLTEQHQHAREPSTRTRRCPLSCGFEGPPRAPQRSFSVPVAPRKTRRAASSFCELLQPWLGPSWHSTPQINTLSTSIGILLLLEGDILYAGHAAVFFTFELIKSSACQTGGSRNALHSLICWIAGQLPAVRNTHTCRCMNALQHCNGKRGKTGYDPRMYVRTDSAEYTTEHNEQTQSHPPASTLALGNDRDAALPDDYPFLGIGDQFDHTQSLPQKGLGRTCPVHKDMSRLPSGQWPSQISNRLGSPIIRAMGSVPLE